jgi:hypothetical protein
MNWGKSIILVFILFAIFIFTLAAICMRQEISLVSPSYYKEELAYQKQIDRLNNAETLQIKPTMELNGGALVVTYKNFDLLDSGTVKLFRPSNEKFDREFPLSEGASETREISVGALQPGLYKVRMNWSMKGKEYFIENTVQL